MEHFQYIVMLDYQRVQLLMFNGGLMVQWCDCFMNHHDDWKYRVMKQPDGLKECDWTCGFITIMMLKIPRSSKVYTSVQWCDYSFIMFAGQQTWLEHHMSWEDLSTDMTLEFRHDCHSGCPHHTTSRSSAAVSRDISAQTARRRLWLLPNCGSWRPTFVVSLVSLVSLWGVAGPGLLEPDYWGPTTKTSIVWAAKLLKIHKAQGRVLSSAVLR